MADQATILHADADSFYASVEQRDDPSLRGRPVIVGAGVVLAASYEAKAYGIRTPMGGRLARRLCPHAVVVRPRMEAYSEASKAMFRVFEDTTPFVEGLSIDEAFLDVGGLWRISGTPTEIAVRLRREVLEKVGLPVTVGVARTKFLAKVASGVAKPDGLLVVPTDGELEFLHPASGRTPVGRRADHRYQAARAFDHDRGAGRGARRAGARPTPRPRLRSAPPRPRPQPGSPAGPGRTPQAIDRDAARARPSARDHAEMLDTDLVALADRLARRLRKAHRVCRTITLRLRFDDFSRATRSHTLSEATAHTPTILDVARGLLAAALPMIERQGITLIGLTFGNLSDDRAIQLALPFERGGTSAVDDALDGVRERFGSAAITRAVLLGRDHGQSVPLLPD